MDISKLVLIIANKCKNLLLKIFPYEWLKKIKGKMIEKSLWELQTIKIQPFIRTLNTDGINLVGNFKAETGLGQSCRLVADEIIASGISCSLYQYEQLGIMAEGQYGDYEKKVSSNLPHNINVLHINPHEMGLAFIQNHEKIWNGRYNIGFWLWELEEFPEQWIPCFHCVDEIWTPSEFITNAIRKKTSLPVVTVPYHIEVSVKRIYNRSDFSLPNDQFLFLMMYDRTSMTKRKNPEGVIKAFKKAFKPNENVGLVIKINNCTETEIGCLKSELEEYRNIYFLTEIMERDRVNGLIRCVNAVVSLHRAEGFGLVLAEAMYLGTPVIATNWSSNTEFMTSEIAYLVDYELVEIKEDIGLFKKGNYWAEPDISHAAAYMRMLFENPAQCEILAGKAQKHIQKYLSMGRVTAIINQRIKEIYKEDIL